MFCSKEHTFYGTSWVNQNPIKIVPSLREYLVPVKHGPDSYCIIIYYAGTT